MSVTTADTLREFDLRRTSSREEVLALFLTASHALSHGDLEQGLGPDYDRVTIYRTLKTFLDKGILHKVLDDEGGTKYALCQPTCGKGDHHHDHVHFKCDQCGQTTCLDHVQIPTINLPAGYQRQEVNLLIQGICRDCSK